MYSQNQEAFRTPERVKARHILLKTQGKPAAEEAAIKAKAESLLKQIKGGADFAKLAKENSEDPGSAANGGDLGDWITHGQMVPEFDKAIFTLKPGETSDLVKTMYGYHIVQTLARQDAGVRAFAEVKGELAAQWKKQRVNDLMQLASDKAQAALQKDPTHPEKVAADFNMQVVPVTGYGRDHCARVGPEPGFRRRGAALKKGEVSQAVSANNKWRWPWSTTYSGAPLDLRGGAGPDSRPDGDEPFRPRRSKSTPTNWWKRPRLWAAIWRRRLSRWVWKSRLPMTSTGAAISKESASASYVAEGFSKPDGTIFGPVGVAGRRHHRRQGGFAHGAPICRKLAAQRSIIRDDIKSQRARERNTLFESGVKDMLIKQGKIKIHQDVINRLIGNYRTS